MNDRTRQIVKHLEEGQLHFWRARVMGMVGRGPDDPMTKKTLKEIDGTIRVFGSAIKQLEMLHGKDRRTGNTGVDYPGSGHHYRKYREMSRGLLENQIRRCESEIEVLRRIEASALDEEAVGA